tara:strand:- start:174 stop:380 length:207 start_codon:yes stop_codon:yes gene_type:complete
MAHGHFAPVQLTEVDPGHSIDDHLVVPRERWMAMCADKAVAQDTIVRAPDEDLASAETIAKDAIERSG